MKCECVFVGEKSSNPALSNQTENINFLSKRAAFFGSLDSESGAAEWESGGQQCACLQRLREGETRPSWTSSSSVGGGCTQQLWSQRSNQCLPGAPAVPINPQAIRMRVSPQNVIRQLLILALSLVASPGESLARGQTERGAFGGCPSGGWHHKQLGGSRVCGARESPFSSRHPQTKTNFCSAYRLISFLQHETPSARKVQVLCWR